MITSKYSPVRACLRCGALAALALLLTQSPHAQATIATPQTYASNLGVYGLLPTNTTPADSTNPKVAEFLNSANTDGISVRTYWRDIEPTQGGARIWAYYDGMITAAQAAGKKVILRLEAAWASPQWVLDDVVANGGALYSYYEPHEIEGGGTTAGEAGDLQESMPAPWDTTYLTHWKAFVAAFGAKYNGNATVAGVLISGCSRSTEMYLPGNDSTWTSYGYGSPQVLIDAWAGVIDAYVAAFSNKPVGLSLSQTFANDSGSGLGIVEAVAAYGVVNHPWHFYTKISYWHENNSTTFFPTAAFLGVIDGYTHGGLEPVGSIPNGVKNPTDQQIATAVADAIQDGIGWHALGIHEIYSGKQLLNMGTLKSANDTHRTKLQNIAFTATAQSGQVLLNWTLTTPGSTYPEGIIIQRKTGDFPTSPTDGAAVTTSTASGSLANTATNGTTYYYSVYDDSTDYTIAQAVATPNVAATLLTDGFETDFSKWNGNGTTDWDRATDQEHAGTRSAKAVGSNNDNDLVSDNLNTAGHDTLTIDFWYRETGLEAAEAHLQLYDADAGAYVTVFDLNRSTATEGTWNRKTLVIHNSGADTRYFRSNFRLKFEATATDSGENLWIDDVTVTVE